MNQCQTPIGVMLQIYSYDKEKKPLQVYEWWPASTRNIPPGDYVFSLKHTLIYNENATGIHIKVIDTKQWGHK